MMESKPNWATIPYGNPNGGFQRQTPVGAMEVMNRPHPQLRSRGLSDGKLPKGEKAMIERFGRWIDTTVDKWAMRVMTLAMIPMMLFVVGAIVVGGFGIMIKFIRWATN